LERASAARLDKLALRQAQLLPVGMAIAVLAAVAGAAAATALALLGGLVLRLLVGGDLGFTSALRNDGCGSKCQPPVAEVLPSNPGAEGVQGG
jgi:hypothetical protein